MPSVANRSLDQEIAEARARAYEGDPEAAYDLMVFLPNHLRGLEVAAAYEKGMPNPAYRTLLWVAWNHDHQEVKRAAKGRGNLRKWFEAAEFDATHLPKTLTLYRGGVCFYTEDLRQFESPGTLIEGIAWTRRPEIACCFACRWYSVEERLRLWPNAFPCVVEVTVPQGHVLGHITERQEDEIICFTHKRRKHGIYGTDLDPRRVGMNWRPPPELVNEWQELGARYKSA